jgi:hypothetical protein
MESRFNEAPYKIFFILQLPSPSYDRIFSSAPCSQASSICVRSVKWKTKFHTRTKQQVHIFDVLTAATLKTAVLLYITPCSLVEIQRFIFGWTYYVFRVEKVSQESGMHSTLKMEATYSSVTSVNYRNTHHRIPAAAVRNSTPTSTRSLYLHIFPRGPRLLHGSNPIAS